MNQYKQIDATTLGEIIQLLIIEGCINEENMDLIEWIQKGNENYLKDVMYGMRFDIYHPKLTEYYAIPFVDNKSYRMNLTQINELLKVSDSPKRRTLIYVIILVIIDLFYASKNNSSMRSCDQSTIYEVYEKTEEFYDEFKRLTDQQQQIQEDRSGYRLLDSYGEWTTLRGLDDEKDLKSGKGFKIYYVMKGIELLNQQKLIDYAKEHIHSSLVPTRRFDALMSYYLQKEEFMNLMEVLGNIDEMES